MKKYQGASPLLLKPSLTSQVSQILKYCNDRCLAVCPQGGNTGLVGGSVPVYDEVIINLSKMNTIRGFDESSGIVISDSGVILEQLDSYLREKGHIAPLDLGAKGSCQIGGNAATNAGGIRLLRYGSLHGSILGLEVVLANGTVLDSLTMLRKDNTGYDLKQLFIGSEGTLGIITGLAIACPPKPNSVNVALLGLPNYELALEILIEAKKDLGEILSAFEFFDGPSFRLVKKHFNDILDPFSSVHPFYVLIETSGSNAQHDKEKLDSFLEKVAEKGWCDDGTVAQDQSQQQKIWFVRENITSACGKEGKVYKYDISIPQQQMYTIVQNFKNLFKDDPSISVMGYGHLGDGNLHLNIVAPSYNDATLSRIEPYVYEFVEQHRGSVSAEHGIGVMKPDALHYSKKQPLIQLMMDIKQLMDPKGILNPYKVLPNL
uniref:FAD-binding PCMH-type domain-containing protein n=1 Tax=Arcella intermedia TaxID=1963864 RepID=A0A6B2L3A6_9EUKA